MPLVEITMVEGRSPELIHSAMSSVHNAIRESLGVSDESIRVVIREVPRTHWMAAGITIADRDAQQKG